MTVRAVVIWEDGDAFFPYVLTTDQGDVYGLDPRSAPDLEADWIAKRRRSSQAEAVEERARVRAEILNDLVFERKREADVFVDQSSASVPLDEITPPPVFEVTPDEVLVLEGLEDGYGRVAVMACEVIAISRAWGEDAAAFCAGAGRREAKKRRGR